MSNFNLTKHLANTAMRKQASPILGLLRLATKAKPLAKSFAVPARAPKANLVSAAKSLPTGPVSSKAVNYLNFLGNVPKGERFIQRPLANAYRLGTLDGIPLMRRINQGIIGLTAYGLGSEANKAYKNINRSVDSLADGLVKLPYLRNEEAANITRENLHGLKRDLMFDQTLGALKRKYFDRESSERQRQIDALTRRLALEGVSRDVHAVSSPTAVQTVINNRNAYAAAVNRISDVPKQIVPKPKSTPQLGLDMYRDLVSLPKGPPTSVERILSNRLNPIIQRFPDVDREKLKDNTIMAYYLYQLANSVGE